MPIANHIHDYLKSRDIPFDLIHHYRSEGTVQSAICAHIPLSSMAKAVVMEDHEGHHLMAVVPSSNKVKVHELERLTKRELKLLPENKLTALFEDCDVGAIPAIGPAYHMDTYLDERLLDHDNVYFESGDHQCLVQVSQDGFKQAMEKSHQGDFSESPGDDAAITF